MMYLTLEEQERDAYIKGDIDRANLCDTATDYEDAFSRGYAECERDNDITPIRKSELRGPL